MTKPEERGLVNRFGPVEIDWPDLAGYFGGIGLAFVMDLIAPPPVPVEQAEGSGPCRRRAPPRAAGATHAAPASEESAA